MRKILVSTESYSEKDAKRCKQIYCTSSGSGDIQEKRKVEIQGGCVFLLLTVAASGLAQEFRIVFPPKVKIKNSTRSVYSGLYGISLMFFHDFMNTIRPNEWKSVYLVALFLCTDDRLDVNNNIKNRCPNQGLEDELSIRCREAVYTFDIQDGLLKMILI